MMAEIQPNLDEIVYHGEDPNTEALVRVTIAKLPREVALFAINRCRFMSVGIAVAGLTLPGRIGLHENGRSRNTWIILLDERNEVEHAESIVAHEIAHAWLGHDRIGDIPDDCEVVAANLTKEWGFTGHGADAEFSDRPYRS